MSYDDFWYYTPAPPKKVKGGIKAQRSSRGFAQKWWGRRWIEVLESFNIGARLSRGRSYARSGQVASLDIGKGTIKAKVQGTRSTPYAVTIELKLFTQKDWDRIFERLASEPGFAAQLLRNEMPEELERLFQSMKLPLFPERHGDLKTDCSCPDWSNPCKHIAAVYYLLAEAFDDRPFLLLRLRGIELDDFLSRLRGTRMETDPETEARANPAPLPTEHAAFWRTGTRDIPVDTSFSPTIEHAQLPLRLGAIPFWRSGMPLQESMRRIYAAASGSALEALSIYKGEEGGSIEASDIPFQDSE